MTGVGGTVGRVLDVAPAGDGFAVTLAVGADARVLDWAGAPPAVGDVIALPAVGDAARPLARPAPGAWTGLGDATRLTRRTAGSRSRLEILQARHRIRAAVRDHFEREGFLELDAPLLVRGVSPDASTVPFALDERCLVTSTEFQIKRLIVGGFDRVMTLTQNFRRGETGPTHNPEFTMLEWARAGATLEAIETDLEALLCAAHRRLGGGDGLPYQGRTIALDRPWPRVRVRDALALPGFALADLNAAVDAAGIAVDPAWRASRSLLFSLLLDRAQPRLGHARPVFLTEWPAFLTSSGARGAGDAETTARSELFIAGLELADGFPFLTDADAQAACFAEQLARRAADGAPPVPLDQAYLAALRQGLPAGAGMALGFDRLVMLLTDQADIRDVLAFAWDEL